MSKRWRWRRGTPRHDARRPGSWNVWARATIERLRCQQGLNGAPGIARGPRPSMRGNPAGLTNQQMEVLRLMAGGLRNQEIAETLHVSPKTVGHHVSAVLAKLNARTRAQAVAQAHQIGAMTNT